MRRRDFIAGVAGSATAWPLAARAQHGGRVPRIGVLINLAEDNPEAISRRAAFQQALHQLGWTDGGNIRIDYRWATDDADRLGRNAMELVALAPDLILANGTSSVAALKRATRSVPIVFVRVADPIGAGFVASLARPGGNITGFSLFEYGMSGKWLELLKEISPNVSRAVVIRDSSSASGIGQYGAIQAVAPSFGVELRPVEAHDTGDIERVVAELAREPNCGMIVTSGTQSVVHRDFLISLAARHRLPAVYASRVFARSGALVAYGPDVFDQYRRAAGYVDRILKGENPADLPVQAPTKYELAINLKTAKALGLNVPPSLLARADEVIE